MKKNNLIFIVLVVLICFINLSSTQLAQGQTKWLGNIVSNVMPADFFSYWNQMSLQWLGKWAQTQSTQGNFNFQFQDIAYANAKNHSIPYKEHTFIWRVQDPSWVFGLTSAGRINAIKNWMNTYCQRYPGVDFIDVVNEPLHQVPGYASDLGGNGTTGWDWVITAYQYARQYCPNAKLLINDYNIVAFESSTTKYLQIINLLKAQSLIDGIGIQCHQLQGAGTIPILKNLYRLAATGLNIYVSQLDLFAADDNEQLNLYKKIFPLLYEHPAVKGVTLWGYRTGDSGITTEGLLNGTTERAALKWLKNQYFNSSINKGPRAFWTNASSNLNVNFNSSKSWDFDGTINSYLWNFGDGTTSNLANPSHSYTAAGTYSVSLTVTDNQNAVNTFTDQLVVSNSGSTTVDWTKPIAYCRSKFIGSTIKFNYLSPNWDRYWNQATPEYLGKWTSTEPNKDQMDWSGLDFAWNHTKQLGELFKGHTFVWGQQIPGWVSGLTSANQALQVQEWIKLYCQRYPDYQLIDVVNEPLHETPNYVNAIGGTGATGWDWVIWAYQKARQYCPNAKLLINEYDVLNNDANLQRYLQIINLLKARSLLDGIGEQSHHLETTSLTQITANLNALAATGLPIYISELDIDLADDTQHLNRMKQIVPLFYEHASVKGITFWGYVRGQTWLGGSWLYDPNASGSGTSTQTCTTQNLRSNIPLTLNVWNDYTVSIPTPGKIRAFFGNDGGSQDTVAIDYAIIDGIKYEAENQLVNTGVWNGASCGGQYSQFLHCYGYIEFPSGTSSVTIRAQAQGSGSQQLTIQLVTGCTGGSTTTGLAQQRASLKWLKYEYLPTISSTSGPKAAFKITPNGMMVTFDGALSTDCDSTIVMYSWSFGDTLTGSGVKIDHNFTTAGTYTVQLTVFDSNGKADIISQTVTVGTVVANNPPTASFNTTTTGLTVSVNGANSSDSDGTISSYSWNWGDSSTAGSGVTANHAYTAAGTYNITLTVKDDKNATSTTSKNVTLTVTVTNQPPVARFTNSINGLNVSVNASNSTDDNGITLYTWNWNDSTSTSTGVTATHLYVNAGTYTITLTVTDGSGLTNSTTSTITVRQTVNLPPVCGISSCSIWYLQLNCNSNSTDDSLITNYVWAWGDGQSTSGSNYQSAQHNYTSGKTYNVQLTVYDAAGLSSTCSKSIVATAQTTTNQPPISNFGYYADSLTISFWFSGWDNDGQVVSYLWKFGDGTNSTQIRPIHNYTKGGTYIVVLTVTDDKGAKGNSSQTLVVVNTPKTYHVESFTKKVIKSGSVYYGQMTVKVYDNTGSPLSNVVVSGQLSYPPTYLYDNVNGITNSRGIAVIQSLNSRSSMPYVNASLYSLGYSGGLNLWYNSADNKITSTNI